jgi:hypothetical protein
VRDIAKIAIYMPPQRKPKKLETLFARTASCALTDSG